MKDIKHIFFDLDHTLWDFEENARHTLSEIFYDFKLDKILKTNLEHFTSLFININYELWKKYDNYSLSKEELRKSRCIILLNEFNITNNELAAKIEEKYLSICPSKSILFPYTLETLTYLQKKYSLHILTNGFKTTQTIKLKTSKLTPFFQEIITSECANTLKPHPEMFEYALNKANATVKESIMIGDNLINDIDAAQNMGMQTIHFDPKNKFSNNSINCLSQLQQLL